MDNNKESLTIIKEGKYYPFMLTTDKFKKLLAVQTEPEIKYWFKDEEISVEKLIEILSNK